MKRRTGISLLILILCLFLNACGKGGADKRGIRIYYLNKTDYGIKEQDYMPEADDKERIIEELIAKLCVQPKEMSLRAPITDFRFLSSETKGRIVNLNFCGWRSFSRCGRGRARHHESRSVYLQLLHGDAQL